LRRRGVPTNTCASDGGANASAAPNKPNADTDERNLRDIISLPAGVLFFDARKPEFTAMTSELSAG
jgi:hypothetical protein